MIDLREEIIYELHNYHKHSSMETANNILSLFEKRIDAHIKANNNMIKSNDVSLMESIIMQHSLVVLDVLKKELLQV